MDFFGKRRIFYTLSIVIITIGIIAMIINGGFILDIQFQGGAVISIGVPSDNYNLEDVQNTLSEKLGKVVNAQKSSYDYKADVENPNATSEVYKLDIRVQTDNELTAEEKNKLESYLTGRYGDITVGVPTYNESVSPKAALYKMDLPKGKITNKAAFESELKTVETDINKQLNKKVTTGFSYIYNPDVKIIKKYNLNLKIPSADKVLPDDTLMKVKQIVSDKLGIVISENKNDFNMSTVAPSMGREMLNKSLLAVGVSFGLMILYIWRRFRTISGLSAGVTAVIALLHDTAVMVVVYAIFKYPVNESFIASILTIIGYSINDTIVIFDRIRENTARLKKLNPGELANLSITQSLTRSLNTAFCVVITLVILFVFAKIYKLSSIDQFSFPLIIGMISGAYSTIFISSPLWAAWKIKKMQKNKTIQS